MPNEDLEAFLTGGNKPAEQAPEPAPAPEPEPAAAEAAPVAEETAPAQPEADHDDDEGISPDIEDPKFRRALSAMRRDHKGQAERLRGELTAKDAELARTLAKLEQLEKQAQAPQQAAQQTAAAPPQAHLTPEGLEYDPLGEMTPQQYEAFKDRQIPILNVLEEALRDKIGDEEVDAALDSTNERLKTDKAFSLALAAAVRRERNPYKWMLAEHKKYEAAKEIGPDPVAYRAKIEADAVARARAEWEAERGALPAVPARPQINPAAGITTPSLGSARGSAPRSAPAFSGTPSVEQMFP